MAALRSEWALSERVVEVQGLEKTYVRGVNQVRVLAGLDLSVDAGEFLALMGPSGSGKSTLLNVVAGIDRPTAGRVWVAGSDLNELSETELARWRARHVGFIFQFYNLIPVLSALENVELPLLLTSLGRGERKKRARFALEIVGLADRAEHLPRELSGGQEQRVAIARAIVSDPTLLVADEPTGDLDASSADSVLELLGRLNTEHKKTILMVTHDPHAAQKAKRTIRLEKGVLALGAPA
jgi:putative ABC transport system ATP-binding protein